MNYYEQEIINALAAGKGNVVCAEGGADEVFTRVMERYPVHGSKIDWSRVEGSVEEQEWNLDLHSQSFEQFFRDAVSRFGLSGEVVYVGDGLTDFALSGSIEGFEGLLGDIFEVPHHHYFLGSDIDWCMCFSMEGGMSFGFSTRS